VPHSKRLKARPTIVAAAIALVVAGVGAGGDARAAWPVPAFARGKGDVDVSGDARFGLFAGARELVVWELATGQRRHRARLTQAAWELHPSPNGETTALVAPGRLAEVQLLTGRVVVDRPAPITNAGAHEIAWAPDGGELVLVGFELAELVPGEGTPIVYWEPKLGYVARQIRLPGLVATRGAVVLRDGAGVVIGTPRDLIYLGRSLIDVRSTRHAGTADARVVGVVADGVVVVQRGRLEVLEPKTATVVRTLEVPIADGERIVSHPAARWLVALAEGAPSARVIDPGSGVEAALALTTLGKPRGLSLVAEGLVGLGPKQIVMVTPGP